LCKKLLETEVDGAGIVNNGRALVGVAVELKPDVIVVEIAVSVLNGLDASQQVKEILPNVKVVFLTMNSGANLAVEAFRRWASGYLLKTCTAAEMVTGIREVLRGKSYLSRTLSNDTIGYLRRRGKEMAAEGERLTGRQREVLQLLAEGKAMKDIGGILSVTTRTVAFHKYRIMEV